MVLSLSTAFAATIDLQNVIDGETYTAYKILNYTDNGKTGDDRAVDFYAVKRKYASHIYSSLWVSRPCRKTRRARHKCLSS